MKKRAFSLVEIMQTVILLGIIAGLSVSFFRKLNTDEKIYTATERAITEAVQEAGRQMCNDSTPFCNGIPWEDNCRTIYGNTASYNAESGYCEVAGVACPDPNANYPDAPVMNVINGKCSAAPRCISQRNIGTPAVPIMQNVTIQATPASQFYCPGGIPDYSQNFANVNVAGGGVLPITILCYKLHELLNHKPQDVDDDADLIKTCLTNNIAFTYDTARNDAGITAAIVVANANDNIKDNYSMVLPNGARLYNLGSVFDANGDAYIFIKYDRLDDIDTSVWNKTIKAITVHNPAWVAPAP